MKGKKDSLDEVGNKSDKLLREREREKERERGTETETDRDRDRQRERVVDSITVAAH